MPHNIPYKVRRSYRAKRMSVTISPNGLVTAVAPYTVQEESIHSFVNRHIEWIKRHLAKIDKKINKIENKDLTIFSKRHYQKHKEEARKVITERVEKLSQKVGLKYKRISIRNQRGRWGSCSSQGYLNFNYKLMFTKPEIRDYVIIHELCHLKFLNHSKSYWALVATFCPDYKKWERELKGLV
ncbi:M48 family metallopeptidase [Candidatus Nomurabacteria bacterium]|nr:M48 family metallopeptidase [Candidatus Nomurabacteria bacterium]